MARRGEQHGRVDPHGGPTRSLSGDGMPGRSAPPSEVLAPGSVLGEFVIEALIAEGGQGVVYRARQRQPERTVAIKTLRPSRLDPRRVERFLAECDLLSKNDHPNIVTLHGVGASECAPGVTAPYLVMGYVSSALPITEAADAFGWTREQRVVKFMDACRAVAFLHSRGVRHFDLKPANILVDDLGHVRVSDLGLARSYSERLDRTPGGTLTHMSPEQCLGDPESLDHRSDIYSLGVVLYELLCSRLPIEIRSDDGSAMKTREVFEKICLQPPIPLGARGEGVHPALVSIVMRALEKRPGDRYESVDDMVGALEAYLDGLRDARVSGRFIEHRRRIVRVAAVVGVAVLAAAAALPAGHALGDRSGAVARWEGFLASWFEPMSGAEGPLHTAVIEYGETTDAPALALARGVEGVTPAVQSHRALHGELARALASSGANAVVFDIIFRAQSAYDDGLADGMRALRDAGIGVVVAAPSWWTDEERGKPELSETVWRNADWGVFEAQLTADGRLWMPLAVVREGREALPSLALSSYAASRAGGANFSFSVDERERAIDIEYWTPVEDRPGGRRPVGRPDRLPLTELQNFARVEGMANFGMREGDVVAWYKPVMLGLAPLRRATRRYEDVLGASETELRAWFEGKTVFIGNFTARAGDLHPVGDEVWAGVYFHAITADSLAREARPQACGWRAHYGAALPLALGGAALPVALVARGAGRRRTRRLATAAIVGVSAGVVAPVVCALVYREMWMLLNPVIVALSVAFTGLGVWAFIAATGTSRQQHEMGDLS